MRPILVITLTMRLATFRRPRRGYQSAIHERLWGHSLKPFHPQGGGFKLGRAARIFDSFRHNGLNIRRALRILMFWLARYADISAITLNPSFARYALELAGT